MRNFGLTKNTQVRQNMSVLLCAVLLILFMLNVAPSAAKYVSTISGEGSSTVAKPIVTLTVDNQEGSVKKYLSFADNKIDYFEFSVSNFSKTDGVTTVSEATMTYAIEIFVPQAVTGNLTVSGLYLSPTSSYTAVAGESTAILAAPTSTVTRTIDGEVYNVYTYESNAASFTLEHTTQQIYYWQVALVPTLGSPTGIFSAYVNIVATQVD